MGAYDEALAKSIDTGDCKDLGRLLGGDLIKAHIKAHFRVNPKTGRREFIKDYDDARHKDEVAVSFHKGHKVKVNNPKSKHHGKTMEVSGYSDKYDVVRGKIEGEKHAVDFHADHLEHHDSKDAGTAKVADSKEGSFKPGDRVTITNPRKYDALASDKSIEGVVEYVAPGKVNVKVGSGSYTVDPSDIKGSENKKDGKDKNAAPALAGLKNAVEKKDSKSSNLDGFMKDYKKMSDQQLTEYSNTLVKLGNENKDKLDAAGKKLFADLMNKVTEEVKRRKAAKDAASKTSKADQESLTESSLKSLLKKEGWAYSGKVHGGGSTYKIDGVTASVDTNEKYVMFYGMGEQAGNPIFDVGKIPFSDGKKIKEMLDKAKNADPDWDKKDSTAKKTFSSKHQRIASKTAEAKKKAVDKPAGDRIVRDVHTPKEAERVLKGSGVIWDKTMSGSSGGTMFEKDGKSVAYFDAASKAVTIYKPEEKKGAAVDKKTSTRRSSQEVREEKARKEAKARGDFAKGHKVKVNDARRNTHGTVGTVESTDGDHAYVRHTHGVLEKIPKKNLEHTE